MNDSDETLDDSLLAQLAATPDIQTPVERVRGTKRFDVIRKLGAGGFGEVYEARDREYGNRVALKVLRFSGPDWVYRFKREFRSIADVSHPNLVRLFELFEEEERMYLTMELIDGLSFDEHVMRAPEETTSCFGQLALAVHAVHKAGKVHRDLKPKNVLVERGGRVVLLDFGLAREATATSASAIAGTPKYIAPEQWLGEEATPACDWYSFGVMLYEVLAQRPPYDGTASQVVQAKLAGPPQAISDLRSDVDPELEALCMSLLSRDPRQRPSGEDILAKLAVGAPRRRTSPAQETLVGREIELAALQHALASTEVKGAIVTVHGQAGIGKSALVNAFAHYAREQGALAYVGRCHEAESLQFKGIDGVVDEICADLMRRPSVETAALLPRDASALSRMFPVLKRIDVFDRAERRRRAPRGPHEIRQAASAAFREFLTRLSDTSPIVIVVDDLQWATDDSIKLLTELLTAPTPAVLFIASYRPEATTDLLSGFLNELKSLKGVEHADIALRPLNKEDVEELMQRHGAPSEAERAWQETRGDPYLLQRLLHALESHLGGTDSVSSAIGDSLQALPDDSRSILDILCISSTPLTQLAACRAAGLDEWNSRAVDELRRSRLIRTSGVHANDVIELYHDRVREAVLDALQHSNLPSIHLRLADYLEAHGRPNAGALAIHYRSAGAHAKASLWAQRAADEAAQSLAFARAAKLYLWAADSETDIDRRLTLMAQHAEAQCMTGRRAEGARAFLAAADLADFQEREELVSELRAKAGEHFLLAGHFDRGMTLLKGALEEIGLEVPTTTGEAIAHNMNVSGALASRSLSFEKRTESELERGALRRVDLETAVARALSLTDIRAPLLSAIALSEALDLGEPMRVQRAMSIFVLNSSARAPDDPFIEQVLVAADELARSHEDEAGLAWTTLTRGMVLMHLGDMWGAKMTLLDSRDQFIVLGPAYAREVRGSQIALMAACGTYGADVGYARTQIAVWLNEAEENDDLFALNWLRLVGCYTKLAADEISAAESSLQLARTTWPNVADDMFTVTEYYTELSIEVYARPDTSWEARERLAPRFQQLFTSMLSVMSSLFARLSGNAALCALRADALEREAALRAVDDAAEQIFGTNFLHGAGHSLHAQAHALRGDRAAAIASLETAYREWKDCGMEAPAAAVRLRLAQLTDKDASKALADLAEQGIENAERYATLFVGPELAR